MNENHARCTQLMRQTTFVSIHADTSGQRATNETFLVPTDERHMYRQQADDVNSTVAKQFTQLTSCRHYWRHYFSCRTQRVINNVDSLYRFVCRSVTRPVRASSKFLRKSLHYNEICGHKLGESINNINNTKRN